MTYSLITREIGENAKGSKLTIEEMDGNLLYLSQAISNNRVLTNASTGATLSITDQVLFVNISTSIYVTLPSVSVMQGRKIIFVRTDGGGENVLQINGAFVDGETTYSLYGYNYNSVTFLSDGTTWHKIATT